MPSHRTVIQILLVIAGIADFIIGVASLVGQLSDGYVQYLGIILSVFFLFAGAAALLAFAMARRRPNTPPKLFGVICAILGASITILLTVYIIPPLSQKLFYILLLSAAFLSWNVILVIAGVLLLTRWTIRAALTQRQRDAIAARRIPEYLGVALLLLVVGGVGDIIAALLADSGKFPSPLLNQILAGTSHPAANLTSLIITFLYTVGGISALLTAVAWIKQNYPRLRMFALAGTASAVSAVVYLLLFSYAYGQYSHWVILSSGYLYQTLNLAGFAYFALIWNLLIAIGGISAVFLARRGQALKGTR